MAHLLLPGSNGAPLYRAPASQVGLLDEHIDTERLEKKTIPIHVHFSGSLEQFAKNPARASWSFEKSASSKAFAQLQARDAEGKPTGDLGKVIVHSMVLTNIENNFPFKCGLTITDGNNALFADGPMDRNGRRYTTMVPRVEFLPALEPFKRTDKQLNRLKLLIMGLDPQRIQRASVEHEDPLLKDAVAVLKNTSMAATCMKPDHKNRWIADQLKNGADPRTLVDPAYDPDPSSMTIVVEKNYHDTVQQMVLMQIEEAQNSPEQYFTNLPNLEFRLHPRDCEWDYVKQDASVSDTIPVLRDQNLSKHRECSFDAVITYSICDGPEFNKLLNGGTA